MSHFLRTETVPPPLLTQGSISENLQPNSERQSVMRADPDPDVSVAIRTLRE